MKQRKTSSRKTIAPGGVVTFDLNPEEQIWFRRRNYIKMAVFITTFTSSVLILLLLST